MSQNHVQEHIDLIAKHEQEFLDSRTALERVVDSIASFAGSLTFVGTHLLLFVVWVAWNTVPIPGFSHFDPPPFSLLGTLVAMEAILLASFILMRQSRTSRRSEERDHLMLQVLLLTEKEITAIMGMDRQIAREVGIEKMANHGEIDDLSQHTSIEEVAQNIKDNLPLG